MHLQGEEVKNQRSSVKWQIRSGIIQVLAVACAAIAAWAAASGVRQASRAIDVAQQNAVSQQIADQWATAISAVGQDSGTAQVAGLTLLRRNIAHQVRLAAQGSVDRQSAYDAYETSLDVIATYLRKESEDHGRPQIQDHYAANQLKSLLDMGPQIMAISGGQRPAIDLATVNLWGKSWPRVDFGWLGSAYLFRINLSATNLSRSDLSHAYLYQADLSEADLTGASFRCAYLEGADLRGADLRGADLRGANLRDAKLPPPRKLRGVFTDGVFGSPQGLKITKAVTEEEWETQWNSGICRFQAAASAATG